MRLNQIRRRFWGDYWYPRHVLHKGTILYHGTGGADEEGDDYFHPTDIRGPAWFSNRPEVAEWFARRSYGEDARVLTYRLSDMLILPIITTERAFKAFCVEFDIDTGSAEEMRESVERAGLPGWFTSNNYKPGDDILIVNTSILEPVV